MVLGLLAAAWLGLWHWLGGAAEMGGAAALALPLPMLPTLLFVLAPQVLPFCVVVARAVARGLLPWPLRACGGPPWLRRRLRGPRGRPHRR